MTEPEPANLKVPETALRGVIRTNLDSPRPTPAQLARKQRSIAAVMQLGLPCIDHLPVVEDESEIQPRGRDEIGQRCLAVAICALKGESNDQDLVERRGHRALNWLIRYMGQEWDDVQTDT